MQVAERDRARERGRERRRQREVATARDIENSKRINRIPLRLGGTLATCRLPLATCHAACNGKRERAREGKGRENGNGNCDCG